MKMMIDWEDAMGTVAGNIHYQWRVFLQIRDDTFPEVFQSIAYMYGTGFLFQPHIHTTGIIPAARLHGKGNYMTVPNSTAPLQLSPLLRSA
jgi:hypothetical protein